MRRLQTLALPLAAVLIGLLSQIAAYAAPLMIDNVDACALVSASEVKPLVTNLPLELHATSSKGHGGGARCDWNAVDKGLVADAPPQAALSATVFHLKDAALTARMFKSEFGKTIVPSQVRTANQDDEVARPTSDRLAVRHGAHVVVLDANEQQYQLQREPGRRYRLEAFALKLAGAIVQGPVDGNVLRSACDPLPPQHVLNILTTQPSSLRQMRDGERCVLSVEDRFDVMGAWATNNGEVEIRRSDLVTNAAALKFLKQQMPFLPASTLVKTSDPKDRLLTNVSRPEEVWAVHGSTYIELQVKNPTAAARASSGWLYRVQRLALEAAGATIMPQVGLPPEPVVTIPPDKVGDGEDDRTAAWNPPVHSAPSLAWIIDPIVAAVAFLARHRFLVMSALVAAPIGMALLPKTPRLPSGLRMWRGPLIVLLVVAVIGNLILGTRLANALVYHAGEAGSATITASHATATQYNNHNVRSHDVLIRTADRRVVESRFEDDDFNIYPSHNLTRYPGIGDHFTVRYLRHAPKTFVIVGNDDSPWAKGLRCDALLTAAGDAEAKARFAPGDVHYRQGAAQADKAVHDQGCTVQSDQ